jgi:hypothetical protein
MEMQLSQEQIVVASLIVGIPPAIWAAICIAEWLRRKVEKKQS